MRGRGRTSVFPPEKIAIRRKGCGLELAKTTGVLLVCVENVVYGVVKHLCLVIVADSVYESVVRKLSKMGLV